MLRLCRCFGGNDREKSMISDEWERPHLPHHSRFAVQLFNVRSIRPFSHALSTPKDRYFYTDNTTTIKGADISRLPWVRASYKSVAKCRKFYVISLSLTMLALTRKCVTPGSSGCCLSRDRDCNDILRQASSCVPCSAKSTKGVVEA